MFPATASGQIITIITIAYIHFMPVTRYLMNIFLNSHNNSKNVLSVNIFVIEETQVQEEPQLRH